MKLHSGSCLVGGWIPIRRGKEAKVGTKFPTPLTLRVWMEERDKKQRATECVQQQQQQHHAAAEEEEK